ncbi:MAG: PDZ domain-containing protein [Deltaproteobacteria bacterium]|nr:PDZ domain-containing protein [Deltaproteobacteria bacterium]
MLISRRVLILSAVIFLLTSFLSGCAASNPNIKSGIYHPSIQPGKTLREAINDFLFLVGTEHTVELNKKCGYATAQDGTSLTIIKSAYENNRFTLTYRAYNIEGIRTMYLNLSDLMGYNVAAKDKHVPLPSGINLRCNPDTAKKIADTLFMMKWYLENEIDEFNKNFENFAPLAAQYRELEIKPQISEEQRRLIVQANSLTEKKQYFDAIRKYQQAIAIDPVSSPESHFNLALLEAQINMPAIAIIYMKQYLMLVPDAADARSARDKIYEWELLMPNSNTAANVPRPERGYLGVRFENPSQAQTASSGGSEIKGALVIEVMPGSPAENGGIMAGDIIRSFDGYQVERYEALLSMVAATPVGKTVKVGIYRKGSDQIIKITIDKRQDLK